jgi:hypothetical protein
MNPSLNSHPDVPLQKTPIKVFNLYLSGRSLIAVRMTTVLHVIFLETRYHPDELRDFNTIDLNTRIPEI